ncbi:MULTISPECIES: 2-amino-4-hydroxy-6-hydroxymethyldihydropteridine diphosphokinase [Rheinheimera]|uniref:2-amino-4-hydroxy-6-hydroxymethyldihydropteridine diphosphokinase n=1 Tax=Rheinheimera marina TaxID=1774958 RepID=A0ABV9JNE0_9GAMM
MLYLLSLGSNIAPEQHTPLAVAQLLQRYHSLFWYPGVYTEACLVESDRRFINALCWLCADESPEHLKQQLCLIESQLGRDRTDPYRSIKDRSCDIDILWSGTELQPDWAELLTEPYLVQVLTPDSVKAQLWYGAELLPQSPAAIYFQAETGDKWVIDQKTDAFENWLKARLSGN